MSCAGCLPQLLLLSYFIQCAGVLGTPQELQLASRTLHRNDDSTAPTTHHAAYSLRCHNRTAATVAETVHLVCMESSTRQGYTIVSWQGIYIWY